MNKFIKRIILKIKLVELQNFRKLNSVRIDFDDETTLFVGANNSGKTSAMVALRFFLISPSNLSMRDVTIGNWAKINAIGEAWENDTEILPNIGDFLPKLDVWLDVPLKEIYHVIHIVPTIDWNGGLLGVRLQYDVQDLDKLKIEYLAERKSAETLKAALINKDKDSTPKVWPINLIDFLEKRSSKHLVLNAYNLNPKLLTKSPVDGVAQPQALLPNAIILENKPFRNIIKIDEISAHSDFSNEKRNFVQNEDQKESSYKQSKKPLSEQLRSYYDRHLDPMKKMISEQDLDALNAIQKAEKTFDERLKDAFSFAFQDLEDLGYPGVNNPKININTMLRATDGLKHGSAVEYEVADPSGDGSKPLLLPEGYSGLGYQRLISMVFMLMSFRDDWMKKYKSQTDIGSSTEDFIEPLHLVLVEEPEAHLHAQVQQVFIKNAYGLLRKHDLLKKSKTFTTQLVVSTHSSHVAHEADFSNLRYFRRRQAKSKSVTATTTVSNLSTVFGTEDETTKFVKRYLKATHCDLFFADAAIFVEGQAERILVPHFIRHHFTNLPKRFITLLDLGGSHAHSFKQLVEELGLTTLIIADLDAVVPTLITTKAGTETSRNKSAKPEKGKSQKTSNPVLKSWHPQLEEIDKLLALPKEKHVTPISDGCDLYVAYQKEVKIGSDTLIPRTFEDALIFENQSTLASIKGSSTTKKVKEIISEGLTGEELAEAIYDLLKVAEKAAFALDCVLTQDPKVIVPPTYVHEGLTWLENTLDGKNTNTVVATL